jgi:2-polyprenyl-3-methyl-5-hydroxy-6-metoxy-1,4-benzoquinol methylase
MGTLQENKAIIYEFLGRFLSNEADILIYELGCSKGDILEWLYQHRPKASILGVEIYEPYIEIAKSRGFTIIKEDIIGFVWKRCFHKESKIDSYLLLDVVEHLKKEDALNLIVDMKASGNQILIFSPLGNCPQAEYDGNTYQKHLSSWEEQELKDLGFETWIYRDFHQGLPQGHSTSVIFARWATK